MATFDERKKRFETKFVRDQERSFKIEASRNKFLGLWVAERFGLKDSEAQSYAKEVIAANFQEEGDESMIRKILTDCESRGVGLGEKELREKLSFFQDQARQEILDEEKI